MKHLKILTIAAVAALVCACQRDDLGQYENNNTEEPIRFNISIAPSPQSRLNNDDLNLQKTEFEVGDQLGLWIMRRPIYQTEPMLPCKDNNSEARLINFILTYMGEGEWRFKYDEDKGVFVRLYREPGYRFDYYAFYNPRTKTGVWDTVDPMRLRYTAGANSTGESGTKHLRQEEFLAARNIDCPEGTTEVDLTFYHQLSLLEVRQPGLGSNATVKLFSPKITTTGTGSFAYDPASPEFFTTDYQYDNEATVLSSVDFRLASNGRYRLFLPPQDLPAGDDTYIEICADKNNRSSENTVIIRLEATNDEGDLVEFKRGESRYLEIIPEYNEQLLRTPNSILFTSRLGQVKRVPIAKAYAMWQTDPALKATNPNLYGNLSLKMLWSDREDFADMYEVKLDDANKGAGAKIEMRLKGGTGSAVLYEGNAVYGLYIGDTLRWSWHMWAASDERPDLNTFQYGAGGPVFMSANLGSWPSKNTKVNGEWAENSGAGRGLLYQWGRKDPFPSAAYDGWDFAKNPVIYSLVNDTMRVVNEEYVFGIPVSTQAINVDSTTMNPMAFATNWNPTGTMDLWNVVADADNNNKSPYDPCPVGWRIGADPTQSIWYKPGAGSNLADYTSNTTWDNGVNFDNEDYWFGYYPQTNYRTPSGQFSTEPGVYMWHGGLTGNSFTVDQATSQVETTANNPLAYGMTVRCVQDENDKEIWDTTLYPDYYVWKSLGGKLQYK